MAARKDSHLDKYLKSAAIALALAGTPLAVTGTASADHRDYRDRDNSTISIGLGNIAFGYRDGYWDNDHHWHHWRNHHDYRSYRYSNGANYHNYNHDRDDNDGWRR